MPQHDRNFKTEVNMCIGIMSSVSANQCLLPAAERSLDFEFAAHTVHSLFLLKLP